jgi:hypothetical protein
MKKEQPTPENKAIFMDKESHGAFGGEPEKLPRGRQGPGTAQVKAVKDEAKRLETDHLRVIAENTKAKPEDDKK